MSGEAKYRMVISRTTVDKLGIKLYDKVSSVVAELVSNAYDADAEKVTISVPVWGKFLDTLERESPGERIHISISDNGIGMDSGFEKGDANEVNEYYLKLGTDARKDQRRGEYTKNKGRKRMGHKGIGKLAPFGICKKIEIITSGGKLRNIGRSSGYLTSHLILDYNKINQDTDTNYEPEIGNKDGTLSDKKGTEIILYDFFHKMVPDKETFFRQLGRLFQPLKDFEVLVNNTQESSSDSISGLNVEIDDQTKKDLSESFIQVEETTYPLKGWIAKAKTSYKNPEMAGIRIYARGRLAAVTKDFNVQSGFTGELTIRSYLVGVIEADWLDDDEDLINTGRQDILWDSAKGIALQNWGKEYLRKWASEISDHVRTSTTEKFMTITNFETKARNMYPDNPEVVKSAIQFAKVLGRSIDPARVENQDDTDNLNYLNRLAESFLSIAPQRTIVEKLSNVPYPDNNTLDSIVGLFNDASLAEAASLGEVARIRLAAIDKLDDLLRQGEDSNESDLQKLIEKSPWIIDPRWTALQANRTFKTMKQSFVDFYKEPKNRLQFKNLTDESITVSSVDSNKRADFIFLPVSGSLKIVEIKKKTHALEDGELERILDYYDIVKDFLGKNPSIGNEYPNPEILLICDGLNLSRTPRTSFDSLKEKRILSMKSWFELSAETKKAHQDFLNARS